MNAITSTGASNIDAWHGASLDTASPAAQLSSACALLALLVQSQATTQNGCRTNIEVNAQQLEQLRKELEDAIRQAKEASEHSGFLGFLADVFGSDIAQIAGAVAAVAAMVATAGASAPLILLLIAEGLQLGAKAGAELGLDPKLCMVLSLASVAVGLCTGTGEVQAATEVAQWARNVELGARVVQGGATATGGALSYRAAQFRAEMLHRQADTVRLQANEETTNLDIDDALSMLERAMRVTQRETNTASEIIQNDSDTNRALSHRI